MNKLQKWKFYLNFNHLRSIKGINIFLRKNYGEYETGKIWGDLARKSQMYYLIEYDNVFDTNRHHVKLKKVKKAIKIEIESRQLNGQNYVR